MGDTMYCPKCGQEQFCPCDACRGKHKQETIWKWTDDEISGIICSKCGFTKSVDWWLILEYDVYEEDIQRALKSAKNPSV